MYISAQQLRQKTGSDTTLFFKRSKAGLNLWFSSSKTGCLTKVFEFNLLNYLPKAWDS